LERRCELLLGSKRIVVAGAQIPEFWCRRRNLRGEGGASHVKLKQVSNLINLARDIIRLMREVIQLFR
jgi:hypothetical protein